ncbi:MAG TPA: YeeE/YedE thiosulfate transporter family protein, partial [Nitrospirota bacterium]|nr:YeeE/YedE thiosulfate transporter family protein [Nitrospirota bacterium]
TRVITALSGGMLIGFAARLARGCTSGVALSGGAQLAVGGWIFVIAMFAAGFLMVAFFRRIWS